MIKIEPGSYTDQKIKNKQFYDKMIADGWTVVSKPGSFNTKKFGKIPCNFKYWSRKDPKTGEYKTIPHIGFI